MPIDGDDLVRVETEAVVSSSGYLIESKFVVIGTMEESIHESMLLVTSGFNMPNLSFSSASSLCFRFSSASCFSLFFF